jgi:hypothetical protein
MTEKIELLVRGDIRRLHLEPGDRVVITVNDYLTADTVKQMRKQLELMFPKNRVIFMVGGARLNVVREGE